MFIGRAGKPLLRYGIYQALERMGNAAGIEDARLNPHTFRHTFARSWLANGGDIYKLSLVLGHSEMQTTLMYLKDYQSREARAEHTQFSPVERMRLGKKGGKKKK